MRRPRHWKERPSRARYPAPELPPELAVPGEGLERILGRGVTKGVVAKRLQQSVGAVVQATLESYAAVLRRWAMDALGHIRSEWTAATDGVRAELDRRMGHERIDHSRQTRFGATSSA